MKENVNGTFYKKGSTPLCEKSWFFVLGTHGISSEEGCR